MGLQTCMLPGLSWFQFARGGAIMAHNSYTMCIRGLPDMYTLSPWACGPRASGVHIRQTTHAHGITITHTHIYIYIYIM